MKDLIDAHCHYTSLPFTEYDGSCEFICNSTCEHEWDKIISAAASDTRIHPAIGLHPWYLKHARFGWMGRMRQTLIANPNVMVGEIGLDKGRPNINMQYRVFKAQYKMAAELGRAVHIHCVHAWELLLKVVQANPTPPAIVIHRYTSSLQLMPVLRRAAQDNVYFSYRDITSDRIRKIIMVTPAARLLVETDGWVPDPDKIMELISQIAFIRGCTTSHMASIIYNNSRRVISNGQIAQN